MVSIVLEQENRIFSTTHAYTPLRNGVPSLTSPSLSATLSRFQEVMAPQHVLGDRDCVSSDAAMWYSVPAIVMVEEILVLHGMFCLVSASLFSLACP